MRCHTSKLLGHVKSSEKPPSEARATSNCCGICVIDSWALQLSDRTHVLNDICKKNSCVAPDKSSHLSHFSYCWLCDCCMQLRWLSALKRLGRPVINIMLTVKMMKTFLLILLVLILLSIQDISVSSRPARTSHVGNSIYSISPDTQSTQFLLSPMSHGLPVSSPEFPLQPTQPSYQGKSDDEVNALCIQDGHTHSFES